MIHPWIYGYPFFGDSHNILSIWDRWKRWFLHSSLFAAATLRLRMGLASSVPLTAEQSIGDQEKPKWAMHKTSWPIGYYRDLFYLIYWGWWYPIVGKTYQPTSIYTNEMGYVTCFVFLIAQVMFFFTSWAAERFAADIWSGNVRTLKRSLSVATQMVQGRSMAWKSPVPKRSFDTLGTRSVQIPICSNVWNIPTCGWFLRQTLVNMCKYSSTMGHTGYDRGVSQEW